MNRFELKLGAALDQADLLLIGVPVRWEARRSLTGFLSDTANYPGIVLATHSVTMLTNAGRNDGMVLEVSTRELEQGYESRDLPRLRTAWRRWMAEPGSLNWVPSLADWSAVIAAAGTAAPDTGARIQRRGWTVEEEDRARDSDRGEGDESSGSEEDDRGETSFSLLFLFLLYPPQPARHRSRSRSRPNL